MGHISPRWGQQAPASKPAFCQQRSRWQVLGCTGAGWPVVEMGTDPVCFLPIEFDYVSNFLAGFPRSLSLRTVLKHKNTKRVSSRGEYNKELTFGGREGVTCGRQTQRGLPSSLPLFWIKKRKQKPSNLRLAGSRGKYKTYVCMCECWISGVLLNAMRKKIYQHHGVFLDSFSHTIR